MQIFFQQLPQEVEKFPLGIVTLDDVRKSRELAGRNMSEKRFVGLPDAGKRGVALEDGVGEENARQSGVAFLGLRTEPLELDAFETNRHAVTVDEAVKFELVPVELEHGHRVLVALDDRPGLDESG